MSRFFAFILLSFASLPLFAQSIRGAFETVVFDAARRPVGAIVAQASTVNSYVIRFRLDDGRSVALAVKSDGKWNNKLLYFQTADCTGQAFMRSADFNSSPRLPGAPFGVAVGVDSGLYLVDDNPQFMTDPGSTLEEPGLCSAGGATDSYVSAGRYLLLSDFYTEPFTVQGPPAPAQPTFSDVPANDPLFQFVEMLAASGITAGCGGGKFCPNDGVTRGQMAVFLTTALGLRFAP